MEISELDQLLLVNSLLPSETGLFKQKVVYTSLHVQGSILSAGSEQGTVWIVNTATNKLIKEITETKVCVTLVRLCSDHTFIAIGFKDGLLALVNYLKPSVKKMLREKDSSPITTFLWKDNGDGFLFGCKSGKIMSSKFDKGKAQVDVSHLLDCGSNVIQLSSLGSSLVISTQERPILLYVDTGKLTQIGSRERKPGPYGGCFISNDSIVVARPGLRLWTADAQGKVLSTAKFKDILLGDFPLISLYGGVTTNTTVNEAIQFGILQPWINQWIVCYHGNTVFVLEPHSLSCIGGMTLGQKIVDICTHDKDIYMLVSGHQRYIVKLSLSDPKPPTTHVHTILPLEEEEGCDSAGGKLMDDNNDVVKDGVERKETETTTDSVTSPVEDLTIIEKETEPPKPSIDGDDPAINNVTDATKDTQQEISVDMATSKLIDETAEDHCTDDVQSKDDVIAEENETNEKEDEKTATKMLNAVESRIQNQVADLKGFLSSPLSKLHLVRNESPKEEEDESAVDSQTISTDIKIMLSKPLNKLAQVRLEPPQKEEEKPPKDEPLPPEPLSTDEVERRMQMLKVPDGDDDDDVVAMTKSKHKKKKKQKRKTHQKRTPLSSTHSSVEALNDISNNNDFTEDHQSIQPETTPTLSEIMNNEPITAASSNIITESLNDNHELPANSEQVENPIIPAYDNINTIEESSTSVIKNNLQPEEELDVNQTNSNNDMVTINDSIDTTMCDTPQEIEKSTSTDTDDIHIRPIATIQTISSPLPQQLDSEDILLSDLDKIWSSNQSDNNDDSSGIKIVGEQQPQYKEEGERIFGITRSRTTRTRANAVHIGESNTDLFHHSSTNNQDPLFSDDDSVDEDSNTLSYLNKDDTLTRSNVYKSPEMRDFEDEEEDVGEGEGEGTPAQVRRHTYSHSVSSSYSMEETSSHPLFSGDSDTETEDEEYQVKPDRGESVIAPEYYSIVDNLAVQSNEDDGGYFGKRKRAEAFVPLIQQQSDNEDDTNPSSTEDVDPVTADNWTTPPLPSRHAIQSMCVSSKSIWLVDARSNLFWCHSWDKGRSWQELKKHVSQISSSADGMIVWAVYHQQAYVRQGISNDNPVGSTWVNITRGKRSISRKVKSVSCDNNGVWALTTDGKVLFRREVSDRIPDGRVWIEADTPISFMHVACCNGIVWALDMSGRAYIRENVSASNPSGSKWREVSSPNFNSICIFDNGLVWGVDGDNRLWFRCGATSFEPEGSGHWWEAAIGSLSSKPPVWSTRSLELRHGSFLHNVTSKLVSSAGVDKFTVISGCAKLGLCLLNSNNTLHACWNSITGYHRQPVCTDPLYSISTWNQCALFNNIPWAVRDDGELFCFPSPDKSLRVECQDSVRVLAVSPSAVWALTRKDIWSRQGICDEIPQGYSWDYIELGSHMQNLKIKNLAIGNNVAWAIDNQGKVHFRFGIHPREPGTGMAPAWIEVPQTSHHIDASLQDTAPVTFSSVVVSSDDWLVWALDPNGVPYVRRGVTSNFPVGKNWEMVKGEKLKTLAAAPSKIYALTESGKLLHRKPITEKLPSGHLWKRLPGIFEIISAIPTGDLLLIGEKGLILKQKSKIVMTDSRKEKEALEKCFKEEEWDVL